MSYAMDVKTNLMKLISDMASNPGLYCKSPGKDFTRHRKLDFESLMHFFLSMEAGSLKQELLKYFSYSTDTLSNSAFVQQRSKLTELAFSTLFRNFNALYPCSSYKGKYQLLAADGSSFTFTRNPKDTDSYFAPDGKTTNGYNQVHVVPLFDLLSKRYTDCIVQPIRKKNEFAALNEMIDRYPANDAVKPIFIADRGFHSLNTFAHAIEHKSFFLIRATDIKMRRLLDHEFPEDQETFDVSIRRILTRTHAKKKYLHPELAHLYKFICAAVPFDFIDEQCPEYDIRLRVLRLKVPGDGYINIITNLPEQDFTPDEIKELYRLRWGIETSFRELKYDIGATNFHAKSREYIALEIWARLLLYNFCTIITGNVVLMKTGFKHPQQVNYAVAFYVCHHLLRLKKGEPPPDVEGLIGKNTLPIRPDRTYCRQHRFKVPASFVYRFA